MIKLWVQRRIVELMGYEDEIVISFAISQIEDENTLHTADKKLDPRKMQVNLTGNLLLIIIVYI